MKIEMNEKENLLRELSVEVPAEQVNTKIDQKLKEKQRTVELKGFRKGKAPLNMIRSMYADQMKIEAAEELIKETYPEAIREKDLKVASYPNVTNLDFGDDGSMNYTAEVEVFPMIDAVELDELELTEQTFEIDDEEVDSVMEHLQKKSAEVREVNREVQQDDMVVVDIEKLDDPNNVVPQDKFENQEVDLNNKMTVKEFKEQLPGMKVGDIKEIEVKYAEDYPDKTFAGATLKYKCEVKLVKEQIIPELNDAFAKQTGQAETLLELRMKVRENLKKQKEEDQTRDHKTKIIDHVCRKNEVPVPKALVDEYVHNMTENFKKQYQDQKVDEAEIRKHYEPVGENTIRWNMLLHKLAEQEKIEVQPSDIDELVNKFAENYKITPEQAKESLRQSGNIADLRESILEDKVIAFIKGKAKIITADK